jgi:hypothetical protein
MKTKTVRVGKRPHPLLSFTHPARVTVRESKFKLLQSARHLDISALKKTARSEVEIGEVETECCHHLVLAVVRKGKVVGLNVEPISKDARTPIGPELRRLLEVVKRKLRASRPHQPKFPMPVEKFFAADVADLSINTITCIQICVLGWCIACCFNADIFICGKITIDTTNLPYPEYL